MTSTDCPDQKSNFPNRVSEERVALMMILADFPGGIPWNKEGKRLLRLDVLAYMGQPAATASKEQSNRIRAEIRRLENEVLCVPPYGIGTSQAGLDHIPILLVTSRNNNTNKVTEVALNPYLFTILNKGGQ